MVGSASAFDLLAFHERAVEIDSTESVDEMREFLVETLAEYGLDPEVDDAGNTLATKGDGSPHLVLNTHIDTVPPHVAYERDGDVVRGRGSCDAKGPLAALLDAFLAHDPDGRLTLAITPDEEVLSIGAAALDLDADGYIVGEPTGLDVCNAAKGRFEGTVTVEGVAAHAAEPDSGANAIHGAAPAIAALDSYDDAHGPGTHDSLGAPTLQATTIEGGEATNQLPERCAFTVDRRSVPPETADDFRETLEAHLQAAAPDDVDVSFALTERPTPFLEAFHTPEGDPLAATLAAEAGGEIRPFSAATEASYFASDAPTVVFGPGVLADEEGAVAHAEREYVRRSDIEAAATALRATLAALV
ncbi:M20 family metallopeptidase [Halorarius litoreus]|uniref:M20 family metallopeptidase n=1 Tax=Halorarius litoreus TaxID=2962676 RepID=UPI0020CD49EA|nr:M20 family metallopeptidase [Halorarius litoreus]